MLMARSAEESASTKRSAFGEFVAESIRNYAAAVAMLSRQFCKASFDFSPHSSDSDPEHSLAALHEVDDLLFRCAFVHAGAIAHEGDLREVINAAIAQVIYGSANILE